MFGKSFYRDLPANAQTEREENALLVGGDSGLCVVISVISFPDPTKSSLVVGRRVEIIIPTTETSLLLLVGVCLIVFVGDGEKKRIDEWFLFSICIHMGMCG